MKQGLVLESGNDDCIEALIINRMCYSHKCCKTATEVTTCLKALKHKKDNIDMLKYNIKIRVISFG